MKKWAVTMAEHSFLMSAAVAVLIVLIVGWIGGKAYLWVRNRTDRADDGRGGERDKIAAEFGLPEPPDLGQLATPGSKARAADWREKLHHPAIAFKNRYYEFIGRCGVLLAFIFILMALNLTVLRSEAWLNPFFAATDLFAMLYVLIHWWRSKLANQNWVLSRIHSELMRQWRHLVFAFSRTETEIAAAYEGASKRVETGILKPRSRFLQWFGFGLTSEELETRIEDYWARLSAEFKADAPSEPPANWSATLAAYLHGRPANQLQWYRMRHRQFSRSGSWRGGIMTALFLFTFVLAAANVFLAEDPPSGNDLFADWLSLSLLIATAISAALTYWYISRNERSISHRYVTQRRELENWLKKIAKLIEERKTSVTYDQVLEFEALMVSELIDWVHVTSHDIVELGG